jgi:uncharacterized membrane protein YfcA
MPQDARVGWDLVVGFAFGVVIAILTTPVGVSGAVFLLPVQLSVLNVPSPSVTPTNLLYNVVAVPGALVRYRRAGRLWTDLARRLLTGTIPGVVGGAIIRVYLLPGGALFKILVAVFRLPLGVWLIVRDQRASPRTRPFAPWVVTALGFAAGLVGGLYGIGGGSLLAPILAASGYLLTEVAPAALLSTFVTSCVGAATYAVVALTGRQGAGPHWLLGLACGLGGLVGGYLGASLQPRMPQRPLRVLLGALAIALASAYLIEAART